MIDDCIRTIGTAPSGANHQLWHFVLISDPALKKCVREAAEEEERKLCDGGAAANGSRHLSLLVRMTTCHSWRTRPGWSLSLNRAGGSL
ncbi:hypothetical protein [Parasedimentitalea denitrificans]|uniref:hypothetical protein n=1 Tax=Parasedimentitalea denitrificans TaxID=2211118 RepID=UPI0034E2DC78